MKYSIIGPLPGNSSYSIVKYFNFYRQNLPGVLGHPIRALCPGRTPPPYDETLTHVPRLKARWESYVRWPCELTGFRSDLFHIVDQGLFWHNRLLRGGRRLGTVHDLITYMIGKGLLPIGAAPVRQQLLFRESLRQLMKLDHIVSVSQFTADCLVRELAVPASRITVIPHHIDSRFTPALEFRRAQQRIRWFGEATYVIIHVGKPTLYKNRLGAIKAFALLCKTIPDARLFLVNGACTPEEEEFLNHSGCSGLVTFLPPVTVDELRDIYGAADVLVFPSFFEGFGWPPLEAMACGCPVVSSTRASLREVVGDAALTVDDPDDHERIAELLAEVLQGRDTAKELRRKGLARVGLFSPERALAAVADVYRMLA